MISYVFKYAGKYKKKTFLAMVILTVSVLFSMVPYMLVYQLIEPLLNKASISVAIASSIAAGRNIILMDEPTSGMDRLNMLRLSQELKRLKEAGKTVYVVTHDYEFINECCDSVLRLE